MVLSARVAAALQLVAIPVFCAVFILREHLARPLGQCCPGVGDVAYHREPSTTSHSSTADAVASSPGALPAPAHLSRTTSTPPSTTTTTTTTTATETETAATATTTTTTTTTSTAPTSSSTLTAKVAHLMGPATCKIGGGAHNHTSWPPDCPSSTVPPSKLLDTSAFSWHVPLDALTPDNALLYLEDESLARTGRAEPDYPPFVFGKIFKSGSSTVAAILDRWLLLHDRRVCHWIPPCFAQTSHTLSLPMIIAQASEIDRRRQRLVTFAIVRQPVARVLSDYEMIVRSKKLNQSLSPGGERERLRRLSQGKYSNRLNNRQFHYLRGRGAPRTFFPSGELAVASIDLMLVLERLSESLVVLAHLLHWRLEDMINVHLKHQHYDVSWTETSAMRDLLAELTKHDDDVYAEAQRRLNRWIAAVPQFDEKLERFLQMQRRLAEYCPEADVSLGDEDDSDNDEDDDDSGDNDDDDDGDGDGDRETEAAGDRVRREPSASKTERFSQVPKTTAERCTLWTTDHPGLRSRLRQEGGDEYAYDEQLKITKQAEAIHYFAPDERGRQHLFDPVTS